MFVFPAFNENYKTRKRTFRCCKTCRVKRIRCSISDSNYELNGCDNCKTQGIPCDLTKKKKEKSRSVNASVKDEVSHKPSPQSQSSDFNGSISSTPNATSQNESISTQKRSISSNPGNTGIPVMERKLSHQSTYIESISSTPSGPSTLLHHHEVPRGLQYSSFQAPPPFNPKAPWDSNLLPRGQLPTPTNASSLRSLPSLPSLSTLNGQSFFHGNSHGPSMQSPLDVRSPKVVSDRSKLSLGHVMNVPTPYEFTRRTAVESTSEAIGSLTSNTPISETYSASSPEVFETSEASILESYRYFDGMNRDSIRKIDYKLLKDKFGFNCTFRQSQYHLISAVTERQNIKDPKNKTMKLAKKQSKKSIYLDKSNLSHFKFLLSIHAFTLNSPGFYHIQADDIRKLFEIYFYKVNSVYPVVFEEEFWELYKRGRIPNIISYAVVLTAARDELAEPILARSFLCDGTFAENHVHFLKELEMKIRQLMDFLPELGDTEKLARLVTSLLLTQNFRFNKIGNEQSSGDMGDCISYAYSLLIHNDYFHDMIAQMGALKKSIYLRHLWWMVFVFDRFNAILNGKAMFIKRLDFNIQRPRDLPHLDRLVELAYTLEDTLVAGFRPQRSSGINGIAVNSESLEGDPIFNPGKLISDEVKILENSVMIDNIFAIHESMAPESSSHLPRVEVGIYRDRFVFFMERLVRHQIILILRTGQFRVLRENFKIDHFSLQLSKSLLKMFQMLMNGKNHKLVMATPLLPSLLLVSFSVPSFARFNISDIRMEAPEKAVAIKEQLDLLINEFLVELEKFSIKWWFVHEVVDSFKKKRNKPHKVENPPVLDYMTPKKHTISISTLVNDATDAECVLPSSLSITSPGFYEDVLEKEESETEEDGTEEGSAENASDIRKNDNITNGPQPDPNPTRPTAEEVLREKSSSGLSEYFSNFEQQGSGTTNDSLADDLYFDVAQLAEMVSTDANYIPNVMDIFPESQLDLFF